MSREGPLRASALRPASSNALGSAGSKIWRDAVEIRRARSHILYHGSIYPFAVVASIQVAMPIHVFVDGIIVAPIVTDIEFGLVVGVANRACSCRLFSLNRVFVGLKISEWREMANICTDTIAG